ncbi:shikimate 5-dehydrogenase [Rhodococcus antarcticus]|uniref:shikimate 5-dehydrogenase n=1 Tax=Rhodococcus antarcticus TaxID=2987751 RepID=UPI003F4932B9
MDHLPLADLDDVRLTLTKDTQLCVSLAARPGNTGTRLQNFLYRATGADLVYKAFAPTDLAQAVAGIRGLPIRGAAVSMPYKSDVIPMLDHVAPSAARIGAVNTIVNDAGVLTGHNTDVTAVQALVAGLGVPRAATVCVTGSGGMARAIVSGLHDSGFTSVTVAARTEATGRPLAERHGCAWSPVPVAAELLVNATPVGMEPDQDGLPFTPAQVDTAGYVLESVAYPLETRLVRLARQQGTPTVDGFQVTVLQSVEQFTLYTGIVPGAEIITAAREFVLSRA